jgi:hypothetical protein
MTPGAPDPYPEHKSRRLVARGDVLYSWGTHFPLIRLIRGRNRKPVGFLLNGDRWTGARGWAASSGNDTGSHQTVVLRMAEEFKESLGLWFVTVPQSVLDAAGIDDTSVTLVHRTADWYENKVESFVDQPSDVKWTYAHRYELGGWINSRTGEFRQSSARYGYGQGPKQETCERCDRSLPGWQWRHHEETWDEYNAMHQELLAHARFRHGEWEPVTGREINTGQRSLTPTRHWGSEWTLEDQPDSPTGTVYTKRWQRHWLGESLIKAKIPYATDVRCPTCRGTGIHPHAEAFPGAEGPLTERQDAMWHRWQVHGTGPEPRHSIGSRLEERCETCSSRRTIRATRFRTAYFLSGFDHNEPLPSYFFTELPPDARPSTIEEAYEALKPATVRLAEEMGRRVERQGDQFFIEMPGLTLRELKRQGAEHHKRGGPGREKQQWEPDEPQRWHQKPRFQRYINENCWLNGTTHEASEVVRLGGATYVRGIVRHVPDGRTPDHVPLHLGSKTLWLNVPNRTPVGR